MAITNYSRGKYTNHPFPLQKPMPYNGAFGFASSSTSTYNILTMLSLAFQESIVNIVKNVP
ncbi:hypothetical protein SK128_023874 [Halocaridina rubra]|uniref:Uncharacterized protein n=1 Tax=Halocaridina rubra TaxID=373956 RepID=A0AAN8XEF4_HALRR